MWDKLSGDAARWWSSGKEYLQRDEPLESLETTVARLFSTGQSMV